MSIQPSQRQRTSKAKRKPLRLELLEPRQMLTVVINEIHVDPDKATESVEFIELYNDSASIVDVSNWVIDDALDYQFPASASIGPHDYYVVTQDASDFAAKFGFAADGEWEAGDRLSNDGENVQLRDAGGNIVDEVDYQLGFPWPTIGEIGRSMELINPGLDNNLAGSWRASGGGDVQDAITLLERQATDWSYRKGTSEASSPMDAWRMPGFVEDASWLNGQTSIGYGDGDDNTVLADMRFNYTSVYMRNTFTVDGAIPSTLELNVYSDDGAVVWINGTRVGFFHVADVELAYDDTAFNHEAEWESIIVESAQQFLVAGENTIAVHGLNQALSSSDFSLDVELTIPPVSSGMDPTPGAVNAAFATNAPPQMRQVNHTPEQPTGGQDVLVTMKVTDPDGVLGVTLEYQLVDPGNYIRLDDAAYDTNWSSLAMNDSGINGDAMANDLTYSATIPAILNTHRRLIRYRVTATDTQGSSVTVPYADDPQPNFAYFVYDGVPDYTASLRPGVLPTATYPGNRLDDMATYHLIANATDVDRSQYNGSYNQVQFRGTLVYDGHVYDHIEYRNRGQASTYFVGKNKWKLNFNRGHAFRARDDYGNRYNEDWDKLNILPGTNPWWRDDVSTEGTVLFEPIAFRLYELAGAPASHTQYFQFRVIDDAVESPSDQYDGDFWGLYIGIEQPDGRFLKDRGLPDGNIFNMHGGVFGSTTQRSQGSDLPSDRSDLQEFVDGVNGQFTTVQDWEGSLDLPSYFAWNTINHVANNSDIRNHENVNYYHNQDTGLWHTIPWDLDLTFEDAPHHGIPVTVRENIRDVRNFSSIELQYDNFLRNLTDLLFDSGDAAHLVEEVAGHLTNNGADHIITDSNQAQWDYHPRKNKKGIFYENFDPALLASEDFDGLVDYMKDFVSPGGYGYQLLVGQGNDSGIPSTPVVTYLGTPDYARDQLTFETSAFADPQGAGTFAAMEWRVAEVHNDGVSNFDPTQPYLYEIEDAWTSGEMTTFDSQFTVPAEVISVGSTYRVRVRMQDTQGHWSHWSAAHEFLGGEEVGSADAEIVMAEINYNPSDPTAAELAAGFTDKDDFEFIELINIGNATLPLAGIQFQQVDGEGVDFDFGTSAVADLAPGERVVVVEDLAAFQFRYGTQVPVAGQWSGGLGNNSELVTMTVDGNILHQFAYDDDWYPSTDNGGFTLQIVDANADVTQWGNAASWQASSQMDGSPGLANVVGDFNEDGNVAHHDVDLLCGEISLNRNWYTFDLSSDAAVDAQDMDLLVQNVLATNYGDANLDGLIDEADFDLWVANRFQHGTGWHSGDFNCDGATDLTDLHIWHENRSDVPQPVVDPAVAEAARDALLAGVSNIAVVGAPGQIAVFDPPNAGTGQGAFSVIHDGEYRPIVAAALWGSGKVVAFGHNGYTDFGNAGNSLDTGQFYRNSLEWLSGSASTAINIVTPSAGTRNWLLSQGFTNVSLHSNWESFLGSADVLVAELGPNVSSAKQQAVTDFVQNGGGLVTGGTGWGYKQLGNDLMTMDGNVVLRQAGLSWADGFREATTVATNRSSNLANATAALAFAEQLWAGGSGTLIQQEESGESIKAVLSVLPLDHPLALEIEQAFASRAVNLSATPLSPVSDTLDQAVLTWESNSLQTVPVENVVAHHTAEAVYGIVPVNAPRVTQTITVDTNQTRWQATGLYAAPGEIVTVTVPSTLVNQGYRLRINAHTDDISPRDNWERMPVVHRSFEINSTTIDIASAFGGLIFVDLGNSAPNQGDVSVTIDGAVEAPYFIREEHDDGDWASQLRDRPAPYGVFVSDNLIIVLPKHQIESADLTEPTELMNWWNQSVVLQDDLAGQAGFRTSPELINVDVQNSAGAAHAGYPIQAYEKFWGNLADWDHLRVEGSWGDFHELGHNHQRGWWTFDGDGEVSVNIFSNYTLENLAPDSTNFWAYSNDPVATMQVAISNVSGGGSYSSKSDRWSFWFQLADGFGWEAYRNVFADYEADAANNPSNLPSNNQEEKDQWFTRWSLEVGYDMRQFMVNTWGLNVSNAALNQVASLPDWMPLATTVDDFQINLGDSQLLDLAGSGLGMDGVANFVGIASGPNLGTLADNGDGTYTYLPTAPDGFDSFVVSYQSSAGNVQEFTINVRIGNGFLAGDVNLDGILNMDDITQFIAGWRSDTTGLSDEEKIMLGDLNLDGTTNWYDFAILRQAWQLQFGARRPWEKAWDIASRDRNESDLHTAAVEYVFDEWDVLIPNTKWIVDR